MQVVWPSLCLVLLATGCAGRQLSASVESSADVSSYALAYPSALEASRRQLVADKTRATELSSQIRERELKSNADPQLLDEIVERADAAGRSQAFVAAQREARAFRAFWEEERGAISARVAAAAQKQIGEANCQDVDIGASTGHALREGFDRQLEKRVREHNDAQDLIERDRAALGAGGAAELQKFADDIAYASYLVSVGLIDDRDAIAQRLDEQRRVARTLDRELAQERRYQAEHAKNKEERKASEERSAALAKSRAALDPAANGAQAETKELDQTIEQARADYAAALDAQHKRLRARAEARKASAK
jgi:hypothetical protein